MTNTNRHTDSLRTDELKKIELNILKKFDQICRDNNLKYSIAYGTMIGAVRHKGFIPWDDDIDVLMKREDYEKLLKLKYEDDNFEIKSYRYSKNYYYPFSKMIDKRTFLSEHWRAEKNMGVYIDIFPLDYINVDSNNCPKREKEFSKIYNKAFKWDTVAYILGHKLSHHKELSIRYFVKLLFMLITYPFKRLIIKHTDLLNANNKKGNYCAMLLQLSNDHPFMKSDYFNNIIYTEFEDFKVPIYKEYDSILTSIYGDYMTPPDNKESTHSFKAYRK